MWSAKYSNISVINLNLISEANNNGYLDFKAKMNTFKALILNPEIINIQALSYVWKVTDTSGVTFASAGL
jgi:hypothetical protein